MTREGIADLLGLRVLKLGGHTPASPEARARTTHGTPPSSRKLGTVRRRGPVCTYG